MAVTPGSGNDVKALPRSIRRSAEDRDTHSGQIPSIAWKVRQALEDVRCAQFVRGDPDAEEALVVLQKAKRLQELERLPGAPELRIVLAKHRENLRVCTIGVNMKLILRATAPGVDGQPDILEADAPFGSLDDEASRCESRLPVGLCSRLLQGRGLDSDQTCGRNNEGMGLFPRRPENDRPRRSVLPQVDLDAGQRNIERPLGGDAGLHHAPQGSSRWVACEGPAGDEDSCKTRKG